MPRKMNRTIPPVPSDEPSEQPPLEVPAPTLPPRNKGGRPSKVMLAEREAAATAANKPVPLTPAESMILTRMVLKGISVVVHGDPPEKDECDLVNTPLCGVLNKYDIAGKWANEIALLGSLVIVGSGMRERKRERLKGTDSGVVTGDATRNTGSAGPEGLGQNTTVQEILAASV